MIEKAHKTKLSRDKASQSGHGQATRETVESIVIAVILAFLFRGFIAEAFVIPTGSMAPTLQGRHIDVVCPECGYQYRTGASEENDLHRGYVTTTFCPLCRFPLLLDRQGNPNHRSFSGDRILVGKFSYEWTDPERWDVIVFKYPYNAKQNYIKRLVGLPGELVRIRHGDVFTARRLFDWHPVNDEEFVSGPLPSDLRRLLEESGQAVSDGARWQPVPRSQFPLTMTSQAISKLWEIRNGERVYLWRVGYDGSSSVYGPLAIRRKPAHKEHALAHLVWDTQHVSRTLEKLGWPRRWQDMSASGVWKTDQGQTYRVEASPDDWAWLGYRHIYPNTYEWEMMLQTNEVPRELVRPEGELITDYYAYNDRELSRGGDRGHHGNHWVGDLAIECRVEIGSQQGELLLRLVEGGRFFDCLLDIGTGQVSLRCSGEVPFVDEQDRVVGQPTATTALRGPGKYHLRFSNVDDQLRLWVNGDLIRFSHPTTYRPPLGVRPAWSLDEPGDLVPARIGVRNARVQVNQIRLWRDVYYLAMTHHQFAEYTTTVSEQEIQHLFRSPQLWQTATLFDYRPTAEFVVPPDCFLPLGDNSPQSLDGRMWGSLPYLERDLLIGEAILIYFPHWWRGPFFPLYWPNFQRLGLIH